MAAPDVMGITEIARRLGVSKSYARELATGKSFPESTRLTMGLVWSTEDVEEWIARYRPKLDDEPEG